MDEADSESLKRLFERASALPVAERDAFLDEACSGDPEVQAEVASLLEAADDADPFFESLANAFLSLPPWPEGGPSGGGSSEGASSGGPSSDRASDRLDVTSRDQEPDPLIGRAVRQYRVEEKLGRGGMGVVYRAHDTSLDRTVALKFLPPYLSGDDSATERFLVEARAAAALDHPNVCNVHEIGESEEGGRFIAMTYYEGETLKQKLDRGPLSIEEALDYARQIAAGLSAAHEHGIIHRDIKPGNVIVTPDNTAKVLDFGLAKLADVSLTGTGVRLGTVGYMSPEHLRGERLSERADVWSLGVVLYEMLTGQLPFRGRPTSVVIHAILHEEPQRPSWLRGGIPREVEAIVGRLLAKDPRRRPTSAEFLELLSGEATVPAAVLRSPARALGLWARIRSWRVLAVLVVVLATLLGWWFMLSRVRAPSIESLAVLPLENLTGDSDQDFYASGIHAELVTELGRTLGRVVKSRTSVMRYQDSELSIPEIADELDVDAAIEGDVFLWGDSVRIVARLIRATPEQQEWAASYQDHLRNIRKLYSEITRAVAGAIGVPLTQEQDTRLAGAQPVDPQAYAYYLRGQQYLGRSLDADDIRAAIRLYEQAAIADPSFAGAHGMLAYSLNMAARLPPFEFDRDSVMRVINRALALDPDLPEAHAVLGWLEPDRRAEEFELALQGSLSEEIEAQIRNTMGILRRWEGAWPEAIQHHERAVELDPGSVALMINLCADYIWTRDYEACQRTIDRALALSPDEASVIHLNGALALQRGGDVAETSRAFTEAARLASPVALFNGLAAWSYTTTILFMDADLRGEVLATPCTRFEGIFGRPSFCYVVKAMLLERAGREADSRAYYDSTRVLLEALPDMATRPPGILRMRLAQAYAGLGRIPDAVETTQQAVAEQRASAGQFIGMHYINYWAAEIYTRLGEHEAAIDHLEYLLSRPSAVSVASLRATLTWDPLRDHPRFQALLERFEGAE